jgi:hypothetical protein
MGLRIAWASSELPVVLLHRSAHTISGGLVGLSMGKGRQIKDLSGCAVG